MAKTTAVALVTTLMAMWLCGCARTAESAAEASPAGRPAEAKSVKPVAGAKSPEARPAVGKTVDAKAADAKTAETKTADKAEEPAADKARDLGTPLVEDPLELKRLHPAQPVWVDVKQKRVVFLAETCTPTYGLEFFVTNRDRAYEAVTVTDAKASTVHAGLLAVGAVAGKPAEVYPKYNPPSGTEIEVEVYWKDKQGKRQHCRAQEWMRNMKTKKPLDVDWVFGGSSIIVDKETGKRTYLADQGELISVANVPIAMLDVPLRSLSAIESREFEAVADRVPPKGTPVTLVLTPKRK